MMYRSERPDKGTIVYVGGLVGDVQKSDLELEFEKFGKISRVWVAFNPPGFAFVEFEKKEDAETAVSTLHDADVLGSKLRVEISRGRGRGGRGGMPGRGSGRGSFEGGRGSFSRGRGDFRGGRGGDFIRGRGRGRGAFGGGHPFDRDDDFKPFRGDGFGGRFDEFQDRRRPEFDDRDFLERDFGGRRELMLGRDFREIDSPRGFGAGRAARGRDFPPRDVGGRDFPGRELTGRDYIPRDGGRDFPPSDIGGRDFIRDEERDFVGGRGARDFPVRDYGVNREINGVRGYGAGRGEMTPGERPFASGRDLGGPRDFAVSQATLAGREFGATRDLAPIRDFVGGERDFPGRNLGSGREYGGNRDIPMTRDHGDPREFGGRPSRIDYPDNARFGTGGRGFGDGEMRRAGGFNGNRYSGGDIGGSGDYGGYGARDRFRSRSPIGRGSRPMY